MKHSFLIWGIVLLFVAGTAVASALVIYGVLPNTADDANLEYIDLYNDSCETISLAGISLQDLSGKRYTFTSGVLESGAYRRVARTESKIILNNTDEGLDILDAAGNPMHQIQYSASVRDVPIEWNVTVPNCHVETVEEVVVETGPVGEPTSADVLGAGSTGASASGAVLEPLPPFVPETASWSDVIEYPIPPGEMSAGSGATSNGSASGASLTGITLSGAVSPEAGITIWPGDSESTGTSTGNTIVSASESVSSNQSDSGAVLSGSGAVPAPSVPTIDSTVLVPLRLYLYDQDANGKLDRLSVEYSGTLSGMLNPEKFIVYSASGGLAGRDIETSSGVLRLLSYSGSYLVADLYEQDLYHANLRISGSTSSELRLKSLTWFGLTNVSGVAVLPLTLTQSFGGYDAANIINTAVPNLPLATSNPPGTNAQTTSNSTSPGTPANPVNVSVSTTAPRMLPDPTIVFQSGVTAEWACKTATCRINFVHEVREKFEMCRWNVISAGTGQVIDGCNPKPIVLGGSWGMVGLTLLDSAGILPFQARSFRILPYSGGTSASGPMSLLTETTTGTRTASSSASQKAAASLTGTSAESATHSKHATSKTVTPKAASAKPTKLASTGTTKSGTTKTTTKKTTTTKTPAAPKEPKATPIAPAYQKTDTPSDSVTIGIIGIACAGIGFCVALLRRRDTEPQ